jgi:S-methylmethionine-dependent homocysteine/selenocysteine methylase
MKASRWFLTASFSPLSLKSSAWRPSPHCIWKSAQRLYMSNSPSMTVVDQTEELLDRLQKQPDKVLLLDGGTGEELFARGIPDDRTLWSATALVHPQHHDTLRHVHGDFLQAGAQAIITNSYAIVPALGRNETELISKYAALSVQLAQDAIKKSGKKAIILGSLGPLVESYRADMVLSPEEGVPIYRVLIKAMLNNVNVWLGETLSCIAEAKLVVKALSTKPTPRHPLFVSFTLNDKGCFRDGQMVSDGVPQLISFCEDCGVPCK